MPENENSSEIDIKQALIEFYADPGDQRSLADVAKSLNISEATLYRQRKKYHDEIFNEADKKRKQYLPILRSKGFKVLESKLARSPKMLEMLFKMTGDLIERVEQTNKYETVEQKKQKLGDLLGKYGIKIVTENTPSNRTQLTQVERKDDKTAGLPSESDKSV